jgi:hypothetical protein
VTIDGLTDRPLAGVTIQVDGVGETTTGADGAFRRCSRNDRWEGSSLVEDLCDD